MPEIERRGGVEKVGPIRKALAILAPGEPNEVRFNEEADLVASVIAARAIEKGEAVHDVDFSDVSDLRPVEVPKDAAWVAMVVLPNGSPMLAFDFRRNRGRGKRLLNLALEYVDTSAGALKNTRFGPALESAHAAAELAVTAMMYLSDDNPFKGRRNAHSRRKGWLNQFTRLDNAPRDFHATLVKLGDLRGSARYGDPQLDVTSEEVAALIESVRGIIEHARARVGEPLEAIDTSGVPGVRAGLVDDESASN